MTDGRARPRRRRRTPWLGVTGRIVVLGVAALAAAWLLFGSQVTGFIASFRAVPVGVHNMTEAPIRVTTVVPEGTRAFYLVGPSETRLIPDDPRDLVSVLDADCRIRDTYARASGTGAFVLAEVSVERVTWTSAAMPPKVQPAASAEPCTVH